MATGNDISDWRLLVSFARSYSIGSPPRSPVGTEDVVDTVHFAEWARCCHDTAPGAPIAHSPSKSVIHTAGSPTRMMMLLRRCRTEPTQVLGAFGPHVRLSVRLAHNWLMFDDVPTDQTTSFNGLNFAVNLPCGYQSSSEYCSRNRTSWHVSDGDICRVAMGVVYQDQVNIDFEP